MLAVVATTSSHTDLHYIALDVEVLSHPVSYLVRSLLYCHISGISFSCVVIPLHRLLCVIQREGSETDGHNLFYFSATIHLNAVQVVSGYTIVSLVKRWQ